MVDELTHDQLQRLRRKIGDQNEPPGFEESELQDIWQEVAGDWNKAVLTCYKELIAVSWRFHNYTQNQTKEEKGKIFDNLVATFKLLKAEDAEEKAAATNQIRLTPLSVTKRNKRTG